ncbi:MAG: iron-sulfur cluster assembly protein [Candidatus Cohnella colombiensis]|uniref:Iron-sulfur cluster assembly protein n=1 Tax=Candidatus Cohnella colombiensis TaxID=3121368 RepID=A0AA95JEH5_9BACL|nr:MAG: iron-sulfur cluster assembly protein [Cohnella sp.]
MDDHGHLLTLLQEVYDPELGVNIVDLGLIYELQEDPDKVYVRMTLTTPGCPMHDTIVGGVKWVLREQKPTIEVDVVWEPKWSPDRMNDAAKQFLGYF